MSILSPQLSRLSSLLHVCENVTYEVLRHTGGFFYRAAVHFQALLGRKELH